MVPDVGVIKLLSAHPFLLSWHSVTSLTMHRVRPYGKHRQRDWLNNPRVNTLLRTVTAIDTSLTRGRRWIHGPGQSGERGQLSGSAGRARQSPHLCRPPMRARGGCECWSPRRTPSPHQKSRPRRARRTGSHCLHARLHRALLCNLNLTDHASKK